MSELVGGLFLQKSKSGIESLLLERLDPIPDLDFYRSGPIIKCECVEILISDIL